MSGFASSGVAASTVPMRALSGQPRAATCAAGHARESCARSGLMSCGSVTVTADWPACSAPWVMTVRTGGLARRAVSAFAPTVPSMCGSNASAPQSVGVKLLVFVTAVAGVPYGVASTVETAGLHDVGLRMNGPVPPAGRPCSVNAIRSV